MAKKILTLEKNQIRAKNLYNGDLVTINYHDYFYKGIQWVNMQTGGKRQMLAFWSVNTDFKRYLEIGLLDHILTLKTNRRDDGFNW